MLAVVSDDETLAARVLTALERDHLQVRLLAAAAGPDTLVELERRPTLIVVACPHERRELDRILHRAAGRFPGAIVVAVVAAADRVDLGLMLAGGVDALVRDDSLDAVLAAAVRAAASGHCTVPANLLRPMPAPALSHRERQVLGLALAGLSNAQIAERLYLAPSTVKTHISTAFRRLGVHSRREASARVLGSDDPLQRTVLAALSLAEEYAPGKEHR